MLDSLKDNIFYNPLIKSLKKSKLALSYDTIHLLRLDELFAEDLLEIKKSTSGERICVLIFRREPHCFDPGNNISRQWLQFKDLLLKYEIFNCDFFITSFFTNENHNSIEYLNKNFYDWKFYNLDLDHLYHYNTDFKNLNNVNNSNLFLDECTMKFSYLNFTHRMHRQLFSKFLIRENLVKDNLIAINPFRTQENQKQVKNFLKTKEKILIPLNQNDGWFYNKNLLDLWRDVPLEYIRHPAIDNNFDSTSLMFLNKASFNIVSETVFNYPFVNFTEKTIQALLSKRPFVMIGASGNLQYLRDNGFRTFHTMIDESYDKLNDPNERLEAIMQLVLELNKKSQQELNDMVYAVKDILIHNYSLMLKKITNFTNITK